MKKSSIKNHLQNKTKTSSLSVDEFHRWELPLLLAFLSRPTLVPSPSENPQRFIKLLTKLQSIITHWVLGSSAPATQSSYLPSRSQYLAFLKSDKCPHCLQSRFPNTHPRSFNGPSTSGSSNTTTENCAPLSPPPDPQVRGDSNTPRPGYLPPAGRAADSLATAGESCCEPCLGAVNSRPLHQRSPRRRRRRLLAFRSAPEVRGTRIPAGVRTPAARTWVMSAAARHFHSGSTLNEPTMHRYFRPKSPTPFFPRSEVKTETLANGWEGVKAKANGRGGSSLAPPRPAPPRPDPKSSQGSFAHAQLP